MDTFIGFLEEYKAVFIASLGFLFAFLGFNYQEFLRNYRGLRALSQEMKINAVSCGTMIDSEEIQELTTICLNRVRLSYLLSMNKQIVKYILRVDHVNCLIDDYLSSQKSYTSDAKNRSSENENGLHAKRHRAINALRELQGTIEDARKDLLAQLSRYDLFAWMKRAYMFSKNRFAAFL